MDAARPRGWLIALAHGGQLRAMALTRAGQIRDAEADARLAFDYKLPVTPAPAMLYALNFLLDALVELDEPEAAEAALASAGIGDPPAGVFGAPMVLQSRARLRLAQHRPADAHADLIEAAARWDELGCCHPVLASWRVEAAEALALLGDGHGARKLASEQLDLANLAQRGGLRLIARRARDELLAAGARPRRDMLTGPEALTPAEHRIAALAAAGHTNREIAEQLYITLRTVETHLTHAFQKLQITTRAQLADSMTTAGT